MLIRNMNKVYIMLRWTDVKYKTKQAANNFTEEKQEELSLKIANNSLKMTLCTIKMA